MFSQSHRPAEEPPRQGEAVRGAGRSSGEPSIINTDLKVVGDLHSAGDIQVKGTVEGDINSKSVTIGEGAQVQGSVSAETVHISGTIKGQIQAPSVQVAKTAKVLGDIVHQTLSVEAGAHLDGNCRRLESKKPGEQPTVPSFKPAQAEAKPAQAESTDTEKRVAGGAS
ncbi:MAG: polymer-forming cytoskeletal protein [Kiloniellaceae bacterium]